MFELKSTSIDTIFTCPDCGCKFGQSKEVIFQGTHVVADCECECCENKYYHTIPSGHAALFPISFSQKTLKTSFDGKAKGWLADPLINSFRNKQEADRPITQKIFKKANSIVLLNCLDSCYGHVFLKLLNAQRYLKESSSKGQGLVLLIPSSFEWMVPPGITELWLVEAKLGDFNKRITGLDSFVKKQLERFQSVLLSASPVHPDLSKIDLQEFLKTEKFNLQDFEKKTTQICFVLREDRFWLNNRLDNFLMKAAISKGWMEWMKKYFVLKQNRLIKKLASKIREKHGKKILFYAAGLGRTGDLGKEIADRRKETIDEKGEKEWCDLYAGSHLVIGIHGSNMLIPTALSAGFIELLPRYKIYNLTEDIAMDQKGRYMQFLGRFLDEYSTASLVAEHTVSLINWFPVVRRNMEE
jgi:hypothetical protein